MFESYERARKKKLPKWLVPLLFASVTLHLAVLTAVVLYGQWDIEKLKPPRGEVVIATVVPPPPPPPAKKGSNKVQAKRPDRQIEERKVPDQTTQPVHLAEPVDDEVTSDAEGPGDPLGDPNGDPNSTCTGPGCNRDSPILDSEPPVRNDKCKKPPCKKKKKTTTVMRQHQLDRIRISGITQIHPSPTSKLALARSGSSAMAIVKYCLSGNGKVVSTTLLKSTGDKAYDRKILSTVRTWRYKPLDYDEICTSVTFHYRQR